MVPFNRRGLSLLELMVVISILALLAALSFPAFVASRRQARIPVDLAKLHQCQMACAMYAPDHPGDNGPIPFDLPDPLTAVLEMKKHGSFYGMNFSLMQSACGRQSTSTTSAFDWYLGVPPTGRLLQLVEQKAEQTPLFIDDNCNDPSVDLTALFETRRVLAVLVNGTLVRRSRAGDPDDPLYWEDSPAP